MANHSPSKTDALIHRWVSKKLFVWIVSTVFLATKVLTAEQWFQITLLYVGGQHLHDGLVNWKHGPPGTSTTSEDGK